MSTEEKIQRLEEFKSAVITWRDTTDDRRRVELRSYINQNKSWARREAIDARCFRTLTIGPPPAIGGFIMPAVDPFDMIFDRPYGMSLIPIVTDMVDQTIGALKAGPPPNADQKPMIAFEPDVLQGYVFVAMPMGPP
jgi:hypothetical protein